MSSELSLGALVFAFSLLSIACGSPATPGWQETLKRCPTDAEIGQLVPWDRLQIRVYGEGELSGEYEVSPLGTINFPKVGELRVAGKRCDELERELTAELADAYLRDPYVTCLNLQAERSAVTVDGAVRSPGQVEFRKGIMLTDAIAAREGLDVRAKGNAVVITRKHADGTTTAVIVPYLDIVTAREPNVCLHPGDLIYIQEAAF